MATYTIKISAGTGISNFTYYYYDANKIYRGPMTSSSISIPVYSGTDVYISSVTFRSGYTYPVKCGGWTMYDENGYADDPYIRSNANRTLTISATAKAAATTYQLYVTCSGVSINYRVSTTGATGTIVDGVSRYFDFGTTRGYIQLTSVTPSTGYIHPVEGSSTTGTSSWDITNSSGTILDSTIYAYSGGGVRYVTLNATKQTNYTYYGRITLNANGGRFTTNNSTYIYWPTSGNMSNTGSGGALVSTYLPSSSSSYKPVYSGYSFVGWATDADATTPDHYSGDQVSFTAKSTSSSSPTRLTLYAVWRKIYTLSYATSLSGVSNMPTSSTIAGAGYITCATTIPVKSGYTFSGWAETDGGSVRYVGGNSIYISANKTLYAVFEKITISSFYWTGNSSTDNTKIAKGQPVSNLTATMWNNYLAKVKELSTACGVSFSYSTVSTGSGITASRFNAARTGLVNIKNVLGGSTTLPSAVSSGQTILASYFIGVGSLRNALNGLINIYNSQ